MRNSQKMMIAVLLIAVIALTSVSSSISLLSGTTNPVVNSFTFSSETGSISLTLDEALIENGESTSSRTASGNTYYIEAGKDISKDPTITMNSGSVEAYVFFYMDNNLSSDYFTINCSDSWIKIASDGTKSLYIYESKVDATSGSKTLDALFTKIEVSTTIPEEFISSFDSKTITLQAYAVGTDVDLSTAINQAAEKFDFSNPTTNITVNDN